MKTKNKCKMRLFFSIVLLLILGLSFVNAQDEVYIDSKIYEDFQENEEISIMIQLKDDSELYSQLLTKDFNLYNAQLQKFSDSDLINLKRYTYQIESMHKQDLIGSGLKIESATTFHPAFRGKINKQDFEELKNKDYILAIGAEYTIIDELDVSADIINVDPQVWDLSLTGLGQTICLIDSGFNYTHPNLGGCIGAGCKILAGYDFVTDSNISSDVGTGHGTAVAGTIISDDATYKGIAYEANLVVLRTGTNWDMEDAFDWCIDNAAQYNISVISMSQSINNSIFYSSDCDSSDDQVEEKVNLAYNNDITVVISSGNQASKTGIRRPSCAAGAISVGATYDYDGSYGPSNSCPDRDVAIKDNRVTCFTNRYHNLDLLAPGARIMTTNQTGVLFEEYSGTSFSTPIVAAAAAILQEKFGGTLTPDDIEMILEDSGKPIYDYETQYSYPRIDVYDALIYSDNIDIMHEDWPFYQHDLRRTGFTSEEGDLNEDYLTETTWDFDKRVDATYFDYPSIADVDNHGEMEIITASSRWGIGTRIEDFDGSLYAISYDMNWINPFTGHPYYTYVDYFKELWKYEDLPEGYLIPRAPSISNLKGDSTKYVVFIAQPNNTLQEDTYIYALNGKTGTEWKKHKITKDVQQGGFSYPQYGQTAVEDIDLDGKKDIFFADLGYNEDWQGFLYWLDYDLTPKGKYAIGNYELSGGTNGAIAIANINKSDPYPEIVVPSQYGIYVYRYDSNTDTLVKMWNNSDAYIAYTVAVADVDTDNDFEIIYTTTTDPNICGQIACTKKLHVVDALTGVENISTTLTEHGKYAPAIANLDEDPFLEIVLLTREDFDLTTATYGQYNPSYGHARAFDGKTLSPEWVYPEDNSKDLTYAAPSIADINGNGDLNIVVPLHYGELVILDSEGDDIFSYELGGEMASSPAIADLDNDGKVEIAAKHLTPSRNLRVFNYENYLDYTPGQFAAMDEEMVDENLAFIGNDNNLPQLDIIKDQYIKEGDLIELSANAIDLDSDTITYNYTYPFNSSGQWQTDVNSSGYYVITAEASDGNLTEEQDLLVVVYNSNTTHQNQFSDGTTEKNLTYTSAGNKTVYVNVSKLQTMLRAALEIFGNPLNKTQGSYQSPSASVIEYNDLDSTASNAIDGNWNTYYTAGALTGIIAQLEDLTIPADPSHLVLHIKLRIYRGGYGNIGLYNYDTDTYEITNSIPSFTNASDDFYIDFYENSPLWTNNNTHFSAQVDNISNYINSTDIRWYYRYVGDWASQMVYESEVKFVDDGQYPEDVFVDVGNDGSKDFVAWGELHYDRAIQTKMNNSNYEETLQLPANTAVTRYITLPKNITLFNAEIFLGETEVSSLAITENTESTTQVINPNYQEKTLRIRDLYTFNTIIQTENNQTLLSIELTEKNKDEPIVIRDVFVKSNDILGRMDTKLMGHTPVYYEFNEVGDRADLQIDLKRKIDNIQYNTTDYLMYNYYYIKDDKTTENGEYTQYIGAELT